MNGIFPIQSTKTIVNPPLDGSIDLEILPINFTTYLGGNDDELAENSAALAEMDAIYDSQGNIIIVGRTTSTNFPIVNALQPVFAGGEKDIIITKLSPTGIILFSTYYGGSGDEWATKVATDSQDNIILIGTTTSSDFPVSENTFQANHNGGAIYHTDVFILKLSEDGQLCLFSSYFGGSADDWAYGLALDAMDNIIFTGSTYSGDFPILNAAQSIHAGTGSVDAYVSKISANGTLLFSSYLGGSNHDWGADLICDSQNNIFITGGTQSSNFPTLNAYQTHSGGSQDAFLVKYTPLGIMQFALYLGGKYNDRAYDIVVTANSSVVIIGSTDSPDFPIMKAFQANLEGGTDAFICQFSNTGDHLHFSTFLGGSKTEIAKAVTIDIDNNIWLIGTTQSLDMPFIINDSEYYGGVKDSFLAGLTSEGNISGCLYFGGSNSDLGQFIDCYSNASLFDYRVLAFGGFTLSSNIPLVNAIQSTLNGSYDYFLSQIAYPMGPLSPYPEQEGTETLTSSDINTTNSDSPGSIVGFSYLFIGICVLSVVTGYLFYIRRKLIRYS